VAAGDFLFYWLKGPKIENWWQQEIFSSPDPSRPALTPSSLPYNSNWSAYP
jgi:hypothetical protein